MEVGQFTIENTYETSRGGYFLHRIMKVTSVKVMNCFELHLYPKIVSKVFYIYSDGL